MRKVWSVVSTSTVRAGVDDADVDALPGDGHGAAAADPPFDRTGSAASGMGWWSGGAGVADAGAARGR